MLSNRYVVGLLALLIINIFSASSSQANEDMFEMPDELVGIWGDDEMCMAYHRNDLFFIFEKNGSVFYRYGSKTDKWCQMAEGSSSSLEYKARCFNSKLSEDSFKIKANKEEGTYEMVWTTPSSASPTYLHKCDVVDKIKGIGKDPKGLSGDLGFALHAGFSIGYATSSVDHCGFTNINDDIAKLVLVEGAEAGERYALEIQALPAVKYAQDLVMSSSEEGMHAAILDRNEIPGFCESLFEAYGPKGWVIEGFIKSEARTIPSKE